ncbi:Lrp/AsnC ligand binding domain-containing protein [Hoeflea sp. IMCC20628]|uniref:Lrp/AsnC ligand binding domain-containing protein n=1 Tax=Hoeflea sp. IMCC20628 TaxID=1620421 RepID=UPI0012E0B385|nr:Lrp/AsnC ligand binding domain-containing protein [Hoeflea sp. IMCC20628]
MGEDAPEDRLQTIVRFTVDPKRTADIIRKISETVEAKSCYSVSGAFDLIVIVGADTAVRLNPGAAGVWRDRRRRTDDTIDRSRCRIRKPLTAGFHPLKGRGSITSPNETAD